MDKRLEKKYQTNIIRARFTLYMVAIIMAIVQFVQFVEHFFIKPSELMLLLIVPSSIAILGLLSNKFPSFSFLVGFILMSFFLLISLINFNLIGSFFFFFVGISLGYGFWSASKLKKEASRDDNILDNDFFQK